jgi:hypothetical protein
LLALAAPEIMYSRTSTSFSSVYSVYIVPVRSGQKLLIPRCDRVAFLSLFNCVGLAMIKDVGWRRQSGSGRFYGAFRLSRSSTLNKKKIRQDALSAWQKSLPLCACVWFFSRIERGVCVITSRKLTKLDNSLHVATEKIKKFHLLSIKTNVQPIE